MNKILTLPQLKAKISRIKSRKGTIVFTNGCFDLIHPGHIKILKEAKKRGDTLIVGLNSDSSIRKIKGAHRPIIDDNSRAKVLAAIEYVDYIVFFSQETPIRLIKQIKPDIIVKGGDWRKEDIVGHAIAKKVHRVRLAPGHSTSKIIEKIKKYAR
jgi:rfaE bifunctional protein nucleotidyltransferase chain/domain